MSRLPRCSVYRLQKLTTGFSRFIAMNPWDLAGTLLKPHLGFLWNTHGYYNHSMGQKPGKSHGFHGFALITIESSTTFCKGRVIPNCFRFLVLYSVYSSALAVLYLGSSE